MAFCGWPYPALRIYIGEGSRPGHAALRVLVTRMRREAFPGISEPSQRRYKVRQAINALLAQQDY